MNPSLRKLIGLTQKQSREILLLCNEETARTKQSLLHCNRVTIRHSWEVFNLFAEFFVGVLRSKEELHRLSAFWIFNTESTYMVRAAWMNALSWNYGIAHAVLRTALEALIRGAFWECMAHPEFRRNVELLRKGLGVKIDGKNRTVLDWFEDVFKHAPELRNEFDQNSGAIFDKVAFMSERSLSRLQPSTRAMVQQLAAWKVFEPMEDPVASVYDHLYWKLSEDAHLHPNKTLPGRRFAADRPALPLLEFDPDELESFFEPWTASQTWESY